jgi:arylsulfatase
MPNVPRISIQLFFACFLAACNAGQDSSTVSDTAADTSTQPNIIVILADDMGFGDIGVFGSEIETPNIDRLARDGLRMTNFHVGAACSPTRTMLMTGVDNHLAGLGNMLEIQADNQFGKPGYEGHLNDSVVSVATLLRDGGYHTYMVGKWHLGSSAENIPHGRGFDRSFTLMESGADNWVKQPYGPMYDKVHYFEDDKEVDLPTEDYFSTDYYTDKIIEYIDANDGDSKPFFAFVSYQAVHMPHQAPREFIDKYDGVYDEGFAELRKARLERQIDIGVVSESVELDPQFEKTSLGIWQIPDWDAQTDEQKAFNSRRMQTYAGMVDNMDYNVGRIVEHLNSAGIADNTLIVFLSDNGADPNQLQLTPAYRPWYEANYEFSYLDDFSPGFPELGQKGAFSANSYYKTFSTEGGMRVPFVAYFPGKIPAGTSSSTFGFVKDIVPTMLEIAGVARPGSTYDDREINPPTGTSMWAHLTGDAAAIHDADAVIGYELAGSSAVFRGNFKLVRNVPPKGTGEWELYDMVTDPSETNDLANQHPDIVEELIAAYAQYEANNGVVPVPDDYNPVLQLQKNMERGRSH